MGFFTRALDFLTPWDRKGEAQRRQIRKRKDEEQQRAPRTVSIRPMGPTPFNQPQAPSLKTQKPENLFTDLNKSLTLGPKPQAPKPSGPNLWEKAEQKEEELKKKVSGVQRSVVDTVLNKFNLNLVGGKNEETARRKISGQQPFFDKKTPEIAKKTIKDTFSRKNPVIKGAQTVSRAAAEASLTAGEAITGNRVQVKPKGLGIKIIGPEKLISNQERSDRFANEVSRSNEQDNPILSKLKGQEGLIRTIGPIALTGLTASDYATGGGKKEALEEAGEVIVKKGLLDDILKVFRRGQKTEKVINDTKRGKGFEAIEDVLSKADLDDLTAPPRKISVKKDVPVREVEGDNLDIPVSVKTPEKPTPRRIRDFAGDAAEEGVMPSRDELAARRFGGQAPVRPDRRIEGIRPRTPGEPEFVTTGEIEAERIALDDALANKEINKTQFKQANKALDEAQAIDEIPKGRAIQVKEVENIPVTEEIDVPTGLPELPGEVRATVQTSPMAAKTEAAASAPVALPKEVQAVLDNPKQFSKRQVAAARNQRKLAKQMAKTQEETAEALTRIEAASPGAQSGEGFVPTGEFGKSINGGPIQKVSRRAEMQQAIEETSQLSPQDVIRTARENQAGTGGFNRRDIRNIAALIEQKRIPRGSQEWNDARQILKEDGTIWGQTGALRNYTMRRTASTNELISRYESKIYRLADDPTKIESKWFDEVEAAEDAYVNARDDAMAAYNNFTQNPTSANAKIYQAAQDTADKADMAAKQAEYTVATKALKGNKDIKQVRELDKMANEADMYQMDAVDASMLSGTGTFIRNFVNSVIGGAEETLFGGAASRLAGKLTGNKVGGGISKESIEGFGEGVGNLVDVSKARASAAGKNPLEHIKNWSTTGNQIGDTVIDSQVKQNVTSHYTQILKEQGYTGRELRDRAMVMARQDPDNLAREYAGAARVAAGLGEGVTRGNKLETFIKEGFSNLFSMGKPNQATETVGKLFARMTVGFPTAIGRSVIEGTKRFTLGAPTFIKAMREADPLKRSILVKEGIKQAGTGALVIPPLFYALGASGAISGAYPESKEERAQWEREGKTENSIKIGDAWYQLPAYLGSWAIPGLFYASLGRNEGDWSAATVDAGKAVPGLLPTDQASNWLDVVNGRSDFGKFMAQTGAATVRAATPAGALLNQIAKSFDPTKNDTNSGTVLENFVDKVLSGIPGVNNMANIPDKVSDTGDPITNPNPLEIFAGAVSDVQGAGEEVSAEIKAQSDKSIQNLTDSGVFSDPNLKSILDEKDLAIYNKINAGQELAEGELDDLKEALVKGVSMAGTDTAYLEREQYDSNLRALKLKREIMAADKTVKPSSLEKLDIAIKRGEVYKDNEIPYDLIKGYQDTSLTEWRAMGDPEDEDYDPEMYEQLWKVDELLTKAKVSDNYKGKLDQNKYSSKDSGSRGRSGGGGGRSGGKLGTDFGTLKNGQFAPRIQQYDSIDTVSGAVPVIRKVRPNIVHKISSSG